MSLLPVYEAQRRVVASEYLHLSQEKQTYWALLVLASQTPGMPVADPEFRLQLLAIWGVSSVTYTRLIT